MSAQAVSVYPAEVVEAIHDGYRRQLAERDALILYYQARLAEHGDPVVEAEDARVRWDASEHLRGCRALVAAGHEVLRLARLFEASLGPAVELLVETSWLDASERRAA